MLLNSDPLEQLVIVRNQWETAARNVVLSQLALYILHRPRRQLHRAEPLDDLLDAPRVHGRLLPALEELGRRDLAVNVVDKGRDRAGRNAVLIVEGAVLYFWRLFFYFLSTPQTGR